MVNYGYANMIDPRMYAGMRVHNLRGLGDGSATAQIGIRLLDLWGLTLSNSVAKAFNRGIVVDQYARDITIQDSVITGNRSHGIEVQHANVCRKTFALSETRSTRTGQAGRAARDFSSARRGGSRSRATSSGRAGRIRLIKTGTSASMAQ
jgi:hypothetical protein